MFSFILTVSLSGSRTWQSTTNSGALSAGVVDGLTSMSFDPTTCSDTWIDLRSWWTVDLGQLLTIYEVTIFPPQDCCGMFQDCASYNSLKFL